MRHTVGMRLREAGVEKITDEKHANNVSLASIIRGESPTKVSNEEKRPEAGLASGR